MSECARSPLDTAVDRRPCVTGDQVLDAARALAPAIAARAAEVEAARRVPGDLLDALVAAGCFRMLLPRSHGGAGADLPSALRLYEALAAADASVGWTVMIGGSAWVDLVGLRRATFDGLFAAGADVVVAGAFAPCGSITPDSGGYRVTGRWGFASGCEHATVLYGNSVESVIDGVPQMRMAVFSPTRSRSRTPGRCRACAGRGATTSGSTCGSRWIGRGARSTTSRAWTSRWSASRFRRSSR